MGPGFSRHPGRDIPRELGYVLTMIFLHAFRGWQGRVAAAALAGAVSLTAQPTLAPQMVRDAAELQILLDRLQVVGSVLYVAAQPDDENTAVLAAMAKGRKVRTA